MSTHEHINNVSLSQTCHLLHPQMHKMREVLNERWVWFQQLLFDSEIMLQKQKVKFKDSFILSAKELKKKSHIAFTAFSRAGHS